MYKLYYSPHACSLATHVVLNELKQPVEIAHKNHVDNFEDLNPANAVPVLENDGNVMAEGVAILMHLLDKHPNQLLPEQPEKRQQAIQDMLFANATMHPAYSKLFFIDGNITDENVKKQTLQAATNAVNGLWKIVNDRLANQPFLGGDHYTPADILLAVYSRWNDFFNTAFALGTNTELMVQRIFDLESFKTALSAQEADTKKHAA